MEDSQEVIKAVKGNVPSLMFACPTYGPIHGRVYASHITAVGALAKEGYFVKPHIVVVTRKMGLAAASNEMVKVALASNVDYIFWTEMDMLLPSDAITKLLKHAIKYNLDGVSGVYFLRGTSEPCLYMPLPDNWVDNKFAHTRLSTFPKDAIFPIGCPGVGCALFKREVFEKLEFPYWEDKSGPGGHGTDIYFYTKMREAGMQMWADSSVICDQIDEDEPTTYTLESYEKWLHSDQSKGGFVYSGNDKCIQLNSVS
jgi:hypothetical protein